jgi:hypothetical protein
MTLDKEGHLVRDIKEEPGDQSLINNMINNSEFYEISPAAPLVMDKNGAPKLGATIESKEMATPGEIVSATIVPLKGYKITDVEVVLMHITPTKVSDSPYEGEIKYIQKEDTNVTIQFEMPKNEVCISCSVDYLI